MSKKPVPRWILLLLLAGAVILPVSICVILAVSTLLGAMGDQSGGLALQYTALGAGTVWVIDLICLVLAEGLNSLSDTDEGD